MGNKEMYLIKMLHLNGVKGTAILLSILPLISAGQTLGPAMTLRDGTLKGATYDEVTAFDGTSGFTVWLDTRGEGFPPDDIYAQKVNADGSVVWTPNGLPVCTVDQAQFEMKLSPDGAGGLFVVWSDDRPSGWTAIYGQHISSDGTIQWAQDGIQLGANDNDQYQPNVHHISGGEFYLTHGEERRVGFDREYWLVVHRINGAGQQLWEPAGFPALEGIRIMSSALDGEGGVVVFGRIREDKEGYRVQRVLSNQTLAWDNPVEILANLPNFSSSRRFFTYDGDGVGGILIAFYTEGTLRLVRVAGDGSMPWGPTGLLMSENIWNLELPSVVADGSGGAHIAWIEDISPDRLRIQHVLPDGTFAWTAGGVELPGKSFVYFGEPWIAPDGSGGLFASYKTGSDIWAQQLNSNGQTLWDDKGDSGLELMDGFEPKIGPGAFGPIVFIDSGSGLISRVITNIPSAGLSVGNWSEIAIGWIYGLTIDWGSSTYMGYVYVPNLPYIYQVNLGWMYLSSSNRPEHILYDFDLGWILTNEDWGGYYYIYESQTYGQFGEPQP